MEIIVYDHQIVSVCGNKFENFSDILVYENTDGRHQINFEECAKNYQKTHNSSIDKCIGDRNIKEKYFLLYSNGIFIKIIFKKRFLFSFNHLLYGTKTQRFLQLQNLISQTKYTTQDLT